MVSSYLPLPSSFSAFARSPPFTDTRCTVPGPTCIRPRRHYYRFLISDLIDLSSPAFGSRFPIYVMAISLTIPARLRSLDRPFISPLPLLGDFQIASSVIRTLQKLARLHPPFAIWTIHPSSSLSLSHRLDIRLISYMNTILGLALVVFIPPFLSFSFPTYTDVDHTLSTA